MLVLTRKQGQEIVIGDNITVGIVEVKGNKVRLSFDAPNDVHILRAELGKWVNGCTVRHPDPSDADLTEKPTEWEELSFSPDPARHVRATSENSKRKAQPNSYRR
jgi:carbon storage regulator